MELSRVQIDTIGLKMIKNTPYKGYPKITIVHCIAHRSEYIQIVRMHDQITRLPPLYIANNIAYVPICMPTYANNAMESDPKHAIEGYRKYRIVHCIAHSNKQKTIVRMYDQIV